MSRIAATFETLRQHRGRALMPFVMAGDPSLQDTEGFLRCFAESGADLVEIGVPFSDPVADGPTNQRAAQRALATGTTLQAVIDLVERVRKAIHQPIVLLSYYNPIYQYGLEEFCVRAASVGVDGLVIPDLPPEEGNELRAVAAARGIDVSFLAAPTSTNERLALVAASSSGFVYCVSLTGVTGVREGLAADVGGLVGRLRPFTSVPICVGFGVSTPDHARQVAAVADGVIVGSAIVAVIEREGAAAAPALGAFVRQLRAGVDAAVGP